MLWIIPSALGAVTNAVYYISIKKFLQRVEPHILASGSFFFAGIFLFITATINGIPPFGDHLFIAIAGTSILNIIAIVLTFRALASTDISLSVPMISFTPIFLIGTSFIFLHELPSVIGIAGICIFVLGSYVLNISSEHRRFFEPLMSIFQNRGSMYMLIVAFLYSVALNFDKMVVMNSDPVFGSSLVCLVLGSSFFIISLYSSSGNRLGIHRGSKVTRQVRVRALLNSCRTEVTTFIFIGLLLTIESIAINSAFTLQIVPYVIAIKRMSIIITVLYGAFVFREDEVMHRLSGAALMVAGAILIIVYN